MGFIEFIMDNFWIAWLVVAGVFLFVEFETTALVSLWFVIGAVISAGVSVFCDNIIIQLVVFFVCSAVFLFVFKKLYKGKIKPATGEDVDYTPVGKIAIVCEDVTDFGGKVRVDDVYWKAISKDGKISEGEKVKIVSISGTTLIVDKI